MYILSLVTITLVLLLPACSDDGDDQVNGRCVRDAHPLGDSTVEICIQYQDYKLGEDLAESCTSGDGADGFSSAG